MFIRSPSTEDSNKHTTVTEPGKSCLILPSSCNHGGEKQEGPLCYLKAKEGIIQPGGHPATR